MAHPVPWNQLLSSVILILGRLYHVRRVFQSMPKPYIPIKAIDVPEVSLTSPPFSLNLWARLTMIVDLDLAHYRL